MKVYVMTAFHRASSTVIIGCYDSPETAKADNKMILKTDWHWERGLKLWQADTDRGVQVEIVEYELQVAPKPKVY